MKFQKGRQGVAAQGTKSPRVGRPRPSMKRILSSPGGAEKSAQQAGHVLVAFGVGRQVPTSDYAPSTLRSFAGHVPQSPRRRESPHRDEQGPTDKHAQPSIRASWPRPRPIKQSSRNAAIHTTGIAPSQLANEPAHASSGRGSGSFRRSCLSTSPRLNPIPFLLRS
jgi:hypothetical protein